jgi:hypothetical protein
VIPLATAAAICEEKLTPNQNCEMLTPSLTCTAYTFSIFNETSTVLRDSALTLVNGTIYKFNFNESEGSYIVQLCDNSTREIIVEGEDEMAGLAITIFVLLTVAALAALPFIVTFAKNKITNLIMKRCCWLLAIYLMMLNSAMMSTIADNAGIGLTDELFRYMWLFGVAGYIFMGYLVIKTIFDIIELYNEILSEKRMGGN